MRPRPTLPPPYTRHRPLISLDARHLPAHLVVVCRRGRHHRGPLRRFHRQRLHRQLDRFHLLDASFQQRLRRHALDLHRHPRRERRPQLRLEAVPVRPLRLVCSRVHHVDATPPKPLSLAHRAHSRHCRPAASPPPPPHSPETSNEPLPRAAQTRQVSSHHLLG